MHEDGRPPNGHAGVLLAMIRRAHLDLQSSKKVRREDAEWFFSDGGGMSQWKQLLYGKHLGR